MQLLVFTINNHKATITICSQASETIHQLLTRARIKQMNSLQQIRTRAINQTKTVIIITLLTKMRSLLLRKIHALLHKDRCRSKIIKTKIKDNPTTRISINLMVNRVKDNSNNLGNKELNLKLLVEIRLVNHQSCLL